MAPRSRRAPLAMPLHSSTVNPKRPPKDGNTVASAPAIRGSSPSSASKESHREQ